MGWALTQLTCNSPVIIHHTSIFGISTSVSSPVTYLHRSPLGFYFISRLEDDQLKLPCTSCNRRFGFVRIFPSHLGILFPYSARVIRNNLSGSRPCHLEDISILSPCGSVFSYPSSTASISHVIFIPLSARPQSPALWSAAAYCPLTLLALLPHQLNGFVGASYTAVSGAAAIVYGLHSPPIISVCAVFHDVLPCASRLYLSYTYDVYFAWTLTYRRFVSHT